MESNGSVKSIWNKNAYEYYERQTSDTHITISVLNIQSQFTGDDKICKSDNIVRLNFNHPIFLLYVCVIDVLKLNGIRLFFDETEFFNTSDSVLKYTTFENGVIILMGDELNDNIYTNPTVNLSRVENAILKIDTNQEEEFIVRVYAVNYQIASFSGGMFGLKFSK